MPTKKHIEQPLDQGLLFPVDVSPEHPAQIGEVTQGGVFPEDLPPTEESAERRHFHEVVHDQVVKEQQTRNRHLGQLGKHSPLERDGSYLAIRPGDVLYDGNRRVIVTDRNWEEAKDLADKLEAQRVTKLVTQPMLSGPDPAVVRRALAQTADELAIERGLAKKPKAVEAPLGPLELHTERRRAFGSVPNLVRDRHADTERISTLTETDYAHVDPEFLKKSYTVRRGKWVYNGLALNEAEYTTILIDADTTIDRVGARASRSKTLANPIRREEVKISAPLHVFEKDHEKHTGLVESLTSEQERLMKLAELAHSPGFAHTSEADLIILAHEAWQLSFKNLLEVAARTNNLGLEEQGSMERALYDKLINGPQREKIKYWQDLTAVSIEYAKNRRLTLVNSQHRVDSQIRKLTKQLDAFCEEHGILR